MTEEIKLVKAPFGSWINVDAEYTARLYYRPDAYASLTEWNRQSDRFKAVKAAIERRALFEYRVMFVYVLVMIVAWCVGVFTKGPVGVTLLVTGGVMFLAFLVQTVRVSMAGA